MLVRCGFEQKIQARQGTTDVQDYFDAMRAAFIGDTSSLAALFAGSLATIKIVTERIRRDLDTLDLRRRNHVSNGDLVELSFIANPGKDFREFRHTCNSTPTIAEESLPINR